MYIRKTTKTYKGKTYTNYLLVESVHTPKGPRQRIVCSLGSLAPAPREHWLELAHRLEASLQGQVSLIPPDPQLRALVEKARRGRKRRGQQAQASPEADARLTVDTERVALEEAREAGAVHAGHRMWQQLGLEETLRAAGLSDRSRMRDQRSDDAEPVDLPALRACHAGLDATHGLGRHFGHGVFGAE